MNILRPLALGSALMLGLVASSAEAKSKIGIGGSTALAGFGGPSVVIDNGDWHIDTNLLFSTNNNTDVFGLGGRFWYHMDESKNADFSLGGGLAFASQEVTVTDGFGNTTSADSTEVAIELGGQIRAFIAPQVALSADLGLSILTDAEVTQFGAEGFGGASIHYFFGK